MKYHLQEIATGNKNNLIRWRSRYSPQEYPYKIILNLFYELLPTYDLWTTQKDNFGKMLFDNYQPSYEFVLDIFREHQLKYQNTLENILKVGTKIGDINSKSYAKLIDDAKNGSNKAVEELEYCYSVYTPIGAMFINWFAFGNMGHNKEIAQQNIFNMSVIVNNWESFDETFESFKKSCVYEIGGSSNMIGAKITDKLYEPLPYLWT